MLDMRDPVPWNERPVPDALPPLAKLAKRIEQEADAGRNVRLKPETAKKVALALYTRGWAHAMGRAEELWSPGGALPLDRCR